jgi:hypothetical protein
MILDKRLTFTASQALTADAALTDSIDLGVAGVPGRDIGPGQPVYWEVVVLVAPDATTGDETYTFNLQSDEDVAFGSPSLVATLTVPRTAKVGERFVAVVPPIVNSNERYLRAFFDGGGTTPTITVASHLTTEQPPAWQAYDAPFQA